MKHCPDCKEEKSLKSFNKNKAQHSGYHPQCKACAKKRLNDWHIKNPTYQRNYDLKRDYGINLKDFQTLKNNQKNKCLICTKETILRVDHDHVTRKIRGLLCDACNKGLGFFKDNIKNLEMAIIYLHQQEKEELDGYDYA